MSSIRNLINLLEALILVSAAPRAVYCIVMIATNQEQADLYKRRLKNLITFAALSPCILELLTLILNAYLT